jgi:hypothetical protein
MFYNTKNKNLETIIFLVTYLSQLIVSLKNTGATILLALTAHQTPTFTGRSGTSWVRCGIVGKWQIFLQNSFKG